MDTIHLSFKNGCYAIRNEGLVQWDTNKKISVSGIEFNPTYPPQIHYSLNDRVGEAVVVQSEAIDNAIYSDIPNFILENNNRNDYYEAYAWIYTSTGNCQETIHKIVFKIKTRPKPEDYVYTPQEKETYKKIYDKISLLEKSISEIEDNKVLKETDPTVPNWAKQENKPTYTADEVGALPNTIVVPPIEDVNDNTKARHIHANKAVLDGITSETIYLWNNKSEFDGNYSSLKGIPEDIATKDYVDDAVSIMSEKLQEAEITTMNLINRSITTFSIPDSTSTIGAAAFYGCNELTDVYIPDNITSIANYAFYGCSKLVLTSLPDSITSIGAYAFYGCSKLALTSLPEGITSIGANAFYDCWNLKITELPDRLKTIGDWAFVSCRNMVLTSLPEGITSIGTGAFFGCNNLKITELPDGFTTIKNNTFFMCTGLTTFTIPYSVTTIANEAFKGCSKLDNVTFKGKPNTISPLVFQNCTNLTTINVPWAEGEVANAPWGATKATINYNYVETES